MIANAIYGTSSKRVILIGERIVLPCLAWSG